METLIDIKIYLPHRAPMLMVDMIIAMDAERVETRFEIMQGNIFLEGNVFTEPGLIENVAQTCSAIIAKHYFVDENDQDKEGVDVVGFISAIKKMQIYALPLLGNTIFTKAVLISKFVNDAYSICTMGCQVFNNGQLLLDGEINLFIQENNKMA